jgi:hypothetical protein
MGAWNNRKIPRKPKKVKVVKEDTEANPAEGIQPMPNSKPADQASEDLVALKRSTRAELGKLSIGPSNNMSGREGGHHQRGRSGRSEGNVEQYTKVPDSVISPGSPKHPRKIDQSIAVKSKVSAAQNEVSPYAWY